MESFKLNKFEEANNIANAIERIENVVIDSFVGQSLPVIEYVTELLASKRPHMLFTPDGLKDTWNHSRNRDQVITDWLMDTYRRIVLTICSEQVLDFARGVYADSLFIGDITALYNDSDLGSRLSTAKEVTALLKEHRWSIVIMSLYSIDLSDIKAENETHRAKTTD